MITKEQYVEMLDLITRYTSIYTEAFPDKPMSDEFCAGMQKAMDLIQTLVNKD